MPQGRMSWLVSYAVALVTAVAMAVAASDRLNVPASSGVLTTPFSVFSANGGGSGVVSSIAMSNGTGSIVVGSTTFDVVAYQYQDWVSAGQQLYNLFGVSRDSQQLAVLYLYTDLSAHVSTESAATTAAGATLPIDAVWYENFQYAMALDSNASGELSGSGVTPASTDVQFPALTGPVPNRIAYTLAASGPQLTLTPTNGSIVLPDGYTYSVVPFSSVDCSACGDGGWYELHSLLTRTGSSGVPNSEACFLILYFEFTDTSHVAADYGFCLPSFIQPTSLSFAAAWSGGLGVGAFKPPLRRH